jgi:hypothetical protein
MNICKRPLFSSTATHSYAECGLLFVLLLLLCANLSQQHDSTSTTAASQKIGRRSGVYKNATDQPYLAEHQSGDADLIDTVSHNAMYYILRCVRQTLSTALIEM